MVGDIFMLRYFVDNLYTLMVSCKCDILMQLGKAGHRMKLYWNIR